MPDFYQTLKKRRDFITLRKRGRSFHSSLMFVQVLPSKHINITGCRFGITCSSKVGGAVVRNKVKRQIRSLLREQPCPLLNSYTYVFIARPQIVAQPYAIIKKEFVHLLAQIKRNYG